MVLGQARRFSDLNNDNAVQNNWRLWAENRSRHLLKERVRPLARDFLGGDRAYHFI